MANPIDSCAASTAHSSMEKFPAIPLAVKGTEAMVRDLRNNKILIVPISQLRWISIPLQSITQVAFPLD
jgi:hypothetical protein